MKDKNEIKRKHEKSIVINKCDDKSPFGISLPENLRVLQCAQLYCTGFLTLIVKLGVQVRLFKVEEVEC